VLCFWVSTYCTDDLTYQHFYPAAIGLQNLVQGRNGHSRCLQDKWKCLAKQRTRSLTRRQPTSIVKDERPFQWQAYSAHWEWLPWHLETCMLLFQCIRTCQWSAPAAAAGRPRTPSPARCVGGTPAPCSARPRPSCMSRCILSTYILTDTRATSARKQSACCSAPFSTSIPQLCKHSHSKHPCHQRSCQ